MRKHWTHDVQQQYELELFITKTKMEKIDQYSVLQRFSASLVMRGRGPMTHKAHVTHRSAMTLRLL